MSLEDPKATQVLDKFHESLSRIPKAPDSTPSTDILVPYKNLSTIGLISESKFSVYLTTCKLDRQKYAMKVFSYVGGFPDPNFKNEIRFAFLKHPNIINMIQHEENIKKTEDGELKKTCYILLEYAPYGDLFDFIAEHKDEIDEKLMRTYFRELIEGIEYLHQNGIAHLDLKPENLLIGEDFHLKIADFDLSFKKGDEKVLSRGTPYYRAPEMISPRPRFEALLTADIYSAGIVLFLLKSGGTYPHSEDDLAGNINYEDLMYNDNKKFWELHCRVGASYDRCFRELFNNMIKFNPFERFTISQIKASRWYKDSVYGPKDFHEKMEHILHH